MTKRVVAITGIGTLTPAGRGTKALWDSITSGDTCLHPIDPQKYFDPSNYSCQIAGQVPAFNEPRVLTKAMLAQTDRCSQMALVAVLDALEWARLPTDFRKEDSPIASERVCLSLSTIAAGWTYIEHEMHNLWTKGVNSMERYGLTAGFPAGPQGHISILFGIEGRIRTFVSERVSGAHAIIEGAKAIQRGDADVAIAGGTEAPLSPLAWAAYQTSHMLQPTSQPNDSVSTHTGMLISEGSTFLVLEEREHALRRGVPILAEISGWSRGTDPFPLDGSRAEHGKGLTQALQSTLAYAKIDCNAVDMIFPAGPSLTEENIAEESAIKNVFNQIPIIATPKIVIGHLLGAAVVTDVAIATLAINSQMIPLHQNGLSHSNINSIRKRSNLQHALILASGLGGMYACLIISKFM
jgi:3-oxoacyl-(acyl-carrier-protein) synthase